MAEKTDAPPVVDPDHVSETLCDGRFNLYVRGDLATLIFTQLRPQAGPLMTDGTIQNEETVRARITMPLANMVALRDFLAERIVDGERPDHSRAAAGGTKH